CGGACASAARERIVGRAGGELSGVRRQLGAGPRPPIGVGGARGRRRGRRAGPVQHLVGGEPGGGRGGRSRAVASGGGGALPGTGGAVRSRRSGGVDAVLSAQTRW